MENQTPPAGSNPGYYDAVKRALWLVLFANLAVTVIKIVIGIAVGALAVIADGFHSLVDSSSNLIGLAAVNLASRPADDRHPYGYRRYESLGALAIGGLLLVSAWEIASAIFDRVNSAAAPEITPLTLGIIFLTFPVNLIVVILEMRAGKKLNSEILLADAKHTQTDLYITASVLVSIVGVWFGYAWVDLLVASAVVVMIVRAGFKILGETSRWLTDVVVVNSDLIEEIAYSAPGVRFVHRIRSRGTADAAFVDLHVKVDPGMSTSQAHAIASEIERRLEDRLDNVIDALVHIEPAGKDRPSHWQKIAVDMRQIADGMGIGMHDLHIHANPEGVYSVEVHLEIAGAVTLGEAHHLADAFEEQVKKRWPQAGQVVTHLEPVPKQMLISDGEPDPQVASAIKRILQTHLPAEQLTGLQVFHSGEHLHAALTVCMPSQTLLTDAHMITEKIEPDLLKHIPDLSRVTLHVEPEDQE